jgi:hypothetical protein
VSVASTPRLHIGAIDGRPSDAMSGVISPFLLPDGRLVIPTDDRTIRIYSREGELLLWLSI